MRTGTSNWFDIVAAIQEEWMEIRAGDLPR